MTWCTHRGTGESPAKSDGAVRNPGRPPTRQYRNHRKWSAIYRHPERCAAGVASRQQLCSHRRCDWILVVPKCAFHVDLAFLTVALRLSDDLPVTAFTRHGRNRIVQGCQSMTDGCAPKASTRRTRHRAAAMLLCAIACPSLERWGVVGRLGHDGNADRADPQGCRVDGQLPPPASRSTYG